MKNVYLLPALFLLLATTAHAQWSLTGNSISSSNFLGSTNAQSLIFKIDGSVAGKLDASTNENTSFGLGSVSTSTSASYNCSFGYNALNATTGSDNCAFGPYALWTNTSGYDNVAIGYSALEVNGTGTSNTAVGVFALSNNTSGQYNSAFGQWALSYGNGSSNQAFGYQSLDVNAGGSYNNAFGAYALLLNSSGFENVAVGDSALCVNTSGSNNTAVGAGSGPASGNTGLTNSSAFGYGASVNASNKVVIGNTSVTSIGGYANWTNFSDGRFKKNVAENVPGLAFIKLLRPITYTLDIKGVNSFNRGGKVSSTSAIDETAIAEKEKVVYTGFIAQEVEASAKKANYEFSGVVAPQNDKDLYGLRYSDFVVPLVKATQEVNNQMDSMKNVITTLQTQLNDLQAQINSLKKEVVTTSDNDAPILLQNAPNPFTSVTAIHYYIPAKAKTAQLVIADVNGQVLKSVALSARGNGQTSLDGGALANGVYFYSLVVNGKTVDTKKMLLTK